MPKDYRNKILDSSKYKTMGISPKELYLRQNNKCWLELVYDLDEDGEKTLGALYCTDGTDFAETCKMLNPTFECMVCLTNFIMKQKSE